jgi:cell division transport system ATP-binding protein
MYPNGAKALIDVSVRIEKGEFVFLVGPSGAGKSTFIRLIYREEKPSRGSIILSNKNLARMKDREVPLLRRKLGVIFQDFKLLQDRSVLENVAFALHVVGTPKREIGIRAKKAIELVGLATKEKVLTAQLSGGEQQRVCVARAIVNDPMLLIADEPTGNLDPETAWGIMELLYNINKRGTTVIMATHAREIVDQMQKRVIAIEAGKISRDEAHGGYGYDV